MTDLKTELKAAMMEMLSDLISKPTESTTTGFGSWASIATVQRVHIQSRDRMLWYTRAKDPSGKEVNTAITFEQYTGRVVAVNTYIGTSDDSNPKLLVTMADGSGVLTEFSVGLSNLATGQYTNIAKNFLLAIEACDSSSLLSFSPVEGDNRERHVVFLKVAIDGVIFYGDKGNRDWPKFVNETLERFGGSHSVIKGRDDDGPRQATPTAPTSKLAPASAMTQKMSDAAWANLKKFGNSTAEGIEYNRQALRTWCQENYGQPDPRLIPAADQKMALSNAEKMLHEAYHPPVAAEPAEETEEEEPSFFAGNFDDDF